MKTFFAVLLVNWIALIAAAFGVRGESRRQCRCADELPTVPLVRQHRRSAVRR